MINGRLSRNGSVNSNGYNIRIRCSFAKFASTGKRPTNVLKFIDTDLTKKYFHLLSARKKLTGLYFAHRKKITNKIFTLSGLFLAGPVNHIDI
jgi:hypothetical protein